jgi:hypothetical protein
VLVQLRSCHRNGGASVKVSVKIIAVCIAAFAAILVLTKIANQVPAEPPSGMTFSLKAQRVISCSANDITLIDKHDAATNLLKDSSWPPCSVFHKDDVLDFYLSRGEKTHFLSIEKTAWWRRVR